jgi:hypothetical protein
MAQKKQETGNMGMIAGIGALAALSAGAYFLYGTKEGAKRRIKIKGWMLKAKGEVMEKLETLKEVNEEKYHDVVNMVMKKYQGLKNIDQKDVEELVTDFKKHWKNINASLSPKKKVVAKKK